jgi:CheY-like chemotaxis protein
METVDLKLLLADDDIDDCLFFKEVLEDLNVTAELTTVKDGVELMQLISENDCEFDILFLDLNMPRKTGFQCLSEIKNMASLKNLPVIIFSTSLDMNVVDSLYNMGAFYYIRKPGEFSKLKQIIQIALAKIKANNYAQPAKENFILES